MTKLLKKFRKDESGATAIEYGLIAALIAIGIIVAAGNVGTNLSTTFQDIADELGEHTGGATPPAGEDG